MKVTRTELPGVLVIEPVFHEDSRGYFFESYQEQRYGAAGVTARFVQDNQSRSVQGVLRGMHYQLRHPQAKLVSVLQGEIFDVAVDIRKGSPTFGRWAGVTLSSGNRRQLYIPEGFAHGFYVLSGFAEFFYKCSDFYDKDENLGLAWDDPDVSVQWPAGARVLAPRDAALPRLRALDADLPEVHTGLMTILLLGNSGQVGWELARALAPLVATAQPGRAEADQSHPESLRSVVRNVHPSLIVNAAAYTAVDQAQKEPDLAHAINGVAPGVLAEEAARLGIPLVHYSTDYVFDGTSSAPYGENDPVNPVNVYGHSKLAGERAIAGTGAGHLIFRTSWVYGARGKNFLRTILRLARERERLTIVDDQIGAPTWSRLIAQSTVQVLMQRRRPDGTYDFSDTAGVYHLAAAGETSWFGFAKEALALDPRRSEHKVRQVDPVSTSAYGAAERRPANSRLNTTRLQSTFGIALPDWRVSLRQTLAEPLAPG